ncbi:hypothetical protein RchiOBHm_Chr2g0163361 [Rosa chinensis]|uniref:Uncharacterized protein n=1 Tax=Rosa chinensis TaxID=74649 RepID=A0A2P6S3B6_ROSCH|nr:uncharacterized protein LOC112185108 [Rosa chinensis]PRQ53155.1 hypothetical protein RchiOBHm_Chr2g0163361 [Rosa chinensis]
MKMTAAQFGGGAPSTGLRNRTSDFNSVTKKDWVYSLRQTEAKFVALSNRKDLSNVSAVGGSNLSSKHRSQYSRLVAHRRRTRFPVVANQLSSEFGVGCSEVEEKVILKEMHAPLTADRDEPELSDIPVPEAYSPNVKRELLMLSLPAIVGQAIDPIAMLMETAYIGRLGMLHSLKQV